MTASSGSKTWRAVQLGSIALASCWIAGWRYAGGGGFGAAAGALAVLAAPGGLLAVQSLWASHLMRGAGWSVAPARVRWRAWAAEVRWNLRVFGWQQPWRAAACPDTAEPVARRGVLLVHGHLCTRAFWLPWLRWLRARGVPYATVDLWPPGRDLDADAPGVDAALRRLTALTGRPPLVLAHSKGGLVVRAWRRWAQAQGDPAPETRLHALITVGTPHQGTLLAGAATRGPARQMRPGSDWLAALARDEPAAWRARIGCVASEADAVVCPAAWALLPGAGAQRVPDRAHIELAFSAPVRGWVWQVLTAPDDRLPW